jgi:hypothetical protein
MIPSEETLIAFADGELSGDEASQIEALLKDRPDLRKFVDRQHALRKLVNDGMSSALELPIPAELENAVRHAPVSWRWKLGQARSGFKRTVFAAPFVWRTAIPAAALACGLIIGIAAEHAYLVGGAETGSAVVARGELARALSTRLASDGESASGIRVAVSFRSKDGRDCRTFEDGGKAGIACRDPSTWSIAMLVTTAETRSQSAYQMAGSAMPDSVRNAVHEMMVGEPFDATGERNARAHNWVSR